MERDYQSQEEIVVEEEIRSIDHHHHTRVVSGEGVGDGSPPRKLRKENDSRTATVETSDGLRMEVNSFELSRNSRFFRAFFYGPMSKVNGIGIYKLSTVNSRMLRYCIDFLYRLDSLRADNTDLVTAVLVLETAAYLCLIRLEKKLCQLISSLVDPLNIISIYAKVEDSSPSLARELWTKIIADFDKLVENSTFLQLSEQEMINLIKDEHLDIKPKNEHKSVHEWCKSRSEEEKKELVEITQSMQCLSNEFSHDGYIVYKKRYPRSILLSLGGWSSDGVSSAIEVFSTRTNNWKGARPETTMIPLSYHGLIQRKEGLYLIGGFNGHNYFNTNHYFDFEKKEWKLLAPMRYNRSYMSAVALPQDESSFVALGGYTGAERLSTVELYDVDKGVWRNLPSMNKARSDGSAMYVDDKIVAVGGFDGATIHNNIEMFDFHRHKWDIVTPSMHSMRTGVCSIALSRSVFGVFGGFNSQRRLKSVEFFDTREGIWHQMNEMMTTRSNFSVELFDNKIVAAGGYDGGRTTAAVEAYDIRMNKWSGLPQMAVAKSALKVTRVDDLDIIKTFSHPY
ncbi:hypothetical protein PRIPAC_83889 [Pristionchus pacificus]|uniref:BTB And C-terminal Kelch domain containing protein n=1 Tax=Pristionchus pacificus TaxID=54126 RepID=A0A2A6BK39_PRIPA|nr:hypothetical protein PRIPAC_83889 [Pristionchus pacificus]|eukprot:PDM66284.1 BTB And C-terminal Kelch domain containing protein [Pristionchus pacificus]